MECYCNLNHGTERRIIDDMSEIDVQLQKQTSEVSAIEMMQEADIIKKTLEQNTRSNQENEGRIREHFKMANHMFEYLEHFSYNQLF